MKKFIKNLFIFATLTVLCLSIVACGGKKDSGTPKTIYGQEPIFSDYAGFREESPAIIETENGVRYVYYTTNENAYDENTNANPATVIAVRKGTLQDGKWSYGDKKIVLKSEATGWNCAGVRDASIVKGAFKYGETTYSYLMAYTATSSSDNLNANYQIGFALSNTPDGEFLKVSNMPYVTFDPTNAGANAYGAGNPSLVSFDKAGKIRLFYTYADAKLTATRVMELDMTNFTDEDIENKTLDKGYSELNYGAILDTAKALYNVSAAYDETENKFYVIRDMFADSPTLDIMYATDDWFYKPTLSTSVPTSFSSIGLEDVYDETKETEWENIYSGTIITDGYGYISGDSFEVAYTVNVASDSDDLSYLYKSVICSCEIDK